jgi:hypothetical protein
LPFFLRSAPLGCRAETIRPDFLIDFSCG